MEILARRLEDWTDRHTGSILAALSAVYAAEAVLVARHKAFWFDEIYTAVIAGSPDLATTWRANDALDFAPLLNPTITHMVVRSLGLNEITMRLPAIVGFWVLCLCLFRFVRRRAGVFYAFSALLLPATTEAFRYSVEARPYGLVLGSCGLALVAWQSAAGHSRRRLALPLLAASLGCAISAHYYAGLLWIPLAGGELWRSYTKRRIDWSIWTAFLIALAPALWRLGTIRHVIAASTHSWSPAYLGQIREFWEGELQKILPLIAVFLAGMAIVLAFRERENSEDRPPRVAGHEWICGALFLALPMVAVVAGIFVTHIFTPRYALIALIGFFLLPPLAAAHLCRGRALPGLVLMAAAAVPFVIRAHDYGPAPNPLEKEPLLAKALEREPVAISDTLLFLEVWYYAPPRLRDRVLYIADRDHGILFDLRRWVPIPVIEYEKFVVPGRDFLVYEDLDNVEWLAPKLLQDGNSIRVEEFSRTVPENGPQGIPITRILLRAKINRGGDLIQAAE